MSEPKPYATLLAKGEDRRQRILAAAQRLFATQGSRGTSLGQIAREAGISAAGLLHHFDSKEQLLNAVLDARDEGDLAGFDASGDVVEQIAKVVRRYRRPSDLMGPFTVLLTENIDPGAPLHGRFAGRQRDAVGIIAAGIRRGQHAGRYRTDVDPEVKAREIIAFLYGLETSWLLDPSISPDDVIHEYCESLLRRLAPPQSSG